MLTAVTDKGEREDILAGAFAAHWQSQQLLDLYIARGPDPWYTRHEAAVYLQVSLRTIDEWEQRGMRSVGRGKFKRFRRSELDRFFEQMGGAEDD